MLRTRFRFIRQGQGRSQVRDQNRVSKITNKTTEANLT